MWYEPSFTMVSFTRLVICSRISCAPSFLRSFESSSATIEKD
uniref:Cl14808_1 n=1 Tax=Arundo donax TaxID=35708 RepID=A0A0A9FZN5_ARUDO